MSSVLRERDFQEAVFCSRMWVMSEVIWSPEEWARAEFGECQPGDRRRAEQAVKYAQQVTAQPDGSTPEQTETGADCQAA